MESVDILLASNHVANTATLLSLKNIMQVYLPLKTQKEDSL